MHGRSGIHTSKDDNDLLIIAAGYDHSRIVEWQPKRKDARKKVLLFGFPAISPGMFQENILRASAALHRRQPADQGHRHPQAGGHRRRDEPARGLEPDARRRDRHALHRGQRQRAAGAYHHQGHCRREHGPVRHGSAGRGQHPLHEPAGNAGGR